MTITYVNTGAQASEGRVGWFLLGDIHFQDLVSMGNWVSG